MAEGESSIQTHEHDVIVIGAGGAGLRAAIEASAAGAARADDDDVVFVGLDVRFSSGHQMILRS